MQAQRLIPRLPNEITDIVVRELPLLDLVCCESLSRAWKTFIETDNETSKTMFRLPFAVRTNPDPAMRKLAVEGLWDVPYADRNNGGSLWDTVKLHPFLRKRKDLDSEHEYSECCFVNLEHTVLVDEWESKLNQSSSHASWRSMLWTYPPITRAHVASLPYQPEMIMGGPAGYDLISLEGVVMGGLVSALEHKREPRIYRVGTMIEAHAWLWPRWSLWEIEAGGPTTVNDDEVDGDDVVSRLNQRIFAGYRAV